MGGTCCTDRKGHIDKRPECRFHVEIERQVRALENKYEARLRKVIAEFVEDRLNNLKIPNLGNQEGIRKRSSLKGAQSQSGSRESQSRSADETLPSLLFEVRNLQLRASKLQKEDLKIRLRRPGQGYSVALLALVLDLKVNGDPPADWSYEFTVAPYLHGAGKLRVNASAKAVLGLNYIDDYWVLDETGAVRSVDLTLEVEDSWISSAYEAGLWIAKEKLEVALKNYLNKEIQSAASEYLEEDVPQQVLGDVKEELLAIFGFFPPDRLNGRSNHPTASPRRSNVPVPSPRRSNYLVASGAPSTTPAVRRSVVLPAPSSELRRSASEGLPQRKSRAEPEGSLRRKSAGPERQAIKHIDKAQAI